MLFRSIGFKCGTFSRKEPGLTRGTTITAPDNSTGFKLCASLAIATTEAYSVPCEPATRAIVGPGFFPLITTTGMLDAGSDSLGTSKIPTALSPGLATAVPTDRSAPRAMEASHRAEKYKEERMNSVMVCFRQLTDVTEIVTRFR